MKANQYNYFHNGQVISKSNFEQGVPDNWEQEVDQYGEYSYGYYKAIPRD